jgi:hypothetical protein
LEVFHYGTAILEEWAIFSSMRRDEFSKKSPGALVTVPGGWAFVPDALPPPVDASRGLTAGLDRAGRALAGVEGQASR